jgi:hypothetical protein
MYYYLYSQKKLPFLFFVMGGCLFSMDCLFFIHFKNLPFMIRFNVHVCITNLDLGKTLTDLQNEGYFTCKHLPWHYIYQFQGISKRLLIPSI